MDKYEIMIINKISNENLVGINFSYRRGHSRAIKKRYTWWKRIKSPATLSLILLDVQLCLLVKEEYITT
jgi:hypothetical protein